MVLAQRQPKVVSYQQHHHRQKSDPAGELRKRRRRRARVTNNLVDAQISALTNASSVTPTTALLPTITDAKLVDPLASTGTSQPTHRRSTKASTRQR